MYQQKSKKLTMRDRAATDEELPRFVRGKDATPDTLPQDDVAWAIAEELVKFFYAEGITTGKNAAWFHKAGQHALDRSMIREAYSKHRDRFRDGDGRQLTLAQFGRNMVKYFRRNAFWQYGTVEDVIGMFYDPKNLDDCAKGLWRVYKDRRIKKGIN